MKKLSLYLMALLYVLAGAYHFINPNFYEAILPSYIGYHSFLIFFSGVCEFLLGIFLIPLFSRRIAAILITFMLTVFLWLHVQMLIDYWKSSDKHLWLAIIRIPIQFILIWWAYSFTKRTKSN